MKQCDVCLEKTDDLVDLLESHRTMEINEVCQPCRKVLDFHKSKLQTVTSSLLLDWFKRFMENKRSEAILGKDQQ